MAVIPEWEISAHFDPLSAQSDKRTSSKWISVEGLEVQPPTCIHDNEGLRLMDHQQDMSSVYLRDSSGFVAGQLGQHLQSWEAILGENQDRATIMQWLESGVDVASWFKPFCGTFRGSQYDCAVPPQINFPNSRSCAENSVFVARQLEEKIRSGSIELLRRVESCTEWPVCIIPLTVEPSKPRLCHDERFLNLFVKDLPLSWTHLGNYPGYWRGVIFWLQPTISRVMIMLIFLWSLENILVSLSEDG